MNGSNLKIPYGVSNFKTLRQEGLYFVDKSGYIRTLELCGRSLFFVRPRRFGKSLFLSMLRCYYDIAEKDNFDALFGDLDFDLMEPEMELSRGFCDFCLFPERYRSAGVPHSYLVELKFSKADASDATLVAKYQEGLEQLAKYRVDKSVPTLARGTTLHQTVFLFKGAELVRIEQTAEEAMP